jgi:hypothetical protein
LSVTDAAGKAIPNTTYKYKIGGSYSFFDFNVNIRNLKRDAQGNLIGEVLPSNSMAASAMRTLIPKQNLTKDGWLMIKIPNQKLEITPGPFFSIKEDIFFVNALPNI